MARQSQITLDRALLFQIDVMDSVTVARPEESTPCEVLIVDKKAVKTLLCLGGVASFMHAIPYPRVSPLSALDRVGQHASPRGTWRKGLMWKSFRPCQTSQIDERVSI